MHNDAPVTSIVLQCAALMLEIYECVTMSNDVNLFL